MGTSPKDKVSNVESRVAALEAGGGGGSGISTALTETGGPTDLDIAAIPDGSILMRVGTEIVGGYEGETLVLDTDPRLSDSRSPTGNASGDLSGTWPSPTVTRARALRESGGTDLSMGAISGTKLLGVASSIIEGITIGTRLSLVGTTLSATDQSSPYTPSSSEKDALVGTSGTPSSSNKFVTNDDARLPTQDENNALVGTSGTPSSSNKFVTNDDARIPTQGENDALAGTSGTPSSSNKFVTNDDTRIPTQGENDALAGTSGTPSSSNKFVTNDDGRLLGLGGAGAIIAVNELGHGGNGNYDLNGSNTYTGLTLAGSTYSVDATFIIRANDLTIRTGIVLDLKGSPLHVLGTLTMEGTAIIRSNGGDGSGITLGEGASPNLIPTTTTGNVYFGGLDGQAGRSSAVGAGNAQTSTTIVICGSVGGSGGRGSYAGSDAAGGTTYTGTVPSLYEHYHGELLQLLSNGRADVGTARYYLCGGMGGGAGGNRIGSGSGTLWSGAGGGGGGVVCIWAAIVNASASCKIQANGGAGSDAVYTTPGGNAGSGGGGGGGGGVLLFKAAKIISAQLPIFEVKGGNGGAAQSVGAGFGDGGIGGNGSKCIVLVSNYSGSAPTQTVSGGTGGAGNGTGSATGASGSSGIALYKAF